MNMRIYVCFIGLWMMGAGPAASAAAGTMGRATEPTANAEAASQRNETPQAVWAEAAGAGLVSEAKLAAEAADFAGATPTADALWQKADSLLRQIYHGPVERSRQHHCAFGQALEDLVRLNPRPAAYDWATLEGLMYFKSADGRLQMLNWSVPNINGSSSYGGLVWVERPTAAGSETTEGNGSGQTAGKGAAETNGRTEAADTDGGRATDSSAYLYYNLQDFSSYQPYPEALTLTPAQWWGAYYYQAVEHTQGDTLRLTLIGVNHSQSRYAQKVIEVLQRLPDGNIVFGAPIFRREALPQSVPPAAKGGGHTVSGMVPEAAYPNAYIGYKPQGAGDADEAAAYAPATRRNAGVRQTPAMRRIVFRYNPRTDLILRYDYQTYRRYRGAKAKETAAYMIVCDRLMHDPLSLDQTAARLVPAGGVYDAYIFQAPYWYPVEDVIARNPNPERGARNR